MRAEYREFLSSLKKGDPVAVCFDDKEDTALPGFVEAIEDGKIKVQMKDYWDMESSTRTFINGKVVCKSRLSAIIGSPYGCTTNDVYVLRDAERLSAFMTFNLMDIKHLDSCVRTNRIKCNCDYDNRVTATKLIINESLK